VRNLVLEPKGSKLVEPREGDLARKRKGDPVKLAVAVRLRAETEMTVRWIAEHLHMGTPGHLNHLLYRKRKRTMKGSVLNGS
jgi:hypothetical protein